MAFAIGWIMTLLIIAGTILFGIYMYCCYQNEIKMFDNHSDVRESIKNLEKRIKKLEEK